MGVQCRDKKMVVEEVEEAIREAEKFKPTLKQFVLAIGSPRDATLQESIRQIDAQRIKNGRFSVSVVFWDDLCLELASHPQLGRPDTRRSRGHRH